MNLKDFIKAELGKCEAATPGPWRIGHVSEVDDSADVDNEWGQTVAEVLHRGDQPFIASARTNYPAALSALAVAIQALETIESYGYLSEPEDRNKLVMHTVGFATKSLSAIKKELGCE